MTSTDTRYCQHCGAAFKRSRMDYTVNCPAHRTAESRRSVASGGAESTDEYYELGKKDGIKHGHKPGFGGYRSAVFTKFSYAQTIAYEDGYKAGQAERQS